MLENKPAARILIADDNPSMLLLISHLLKGHGYEYRALNTVERLSENIRSFHPDLILLDVCMGVEDGRNSCLEIKMNPDLADIPVVLISGHPMDAESVADCGAADFLSKPFTVTEMITTVETYRAHPVITEVLA